MGKDAREVWEVTLEPGSPELGFIEDLGNRSKVSTSVSYLESYKKFQLPYKLGYMSDWWVIHSSVNQTGTDTLRKSSYNPNSQNISDKEDWNVRYVFGPAPGREWWSLDGKNLELRIPAYVAGEEKMIALFETPDEPPYYGSNHMLNFSIVYPDIWEEGLGEVGPTKVAAWAKRTPWGKRCKNGGFAVQYGAILKALGGTADRAFGREGCHALLIDTFQAIHGEDGLNQQCIAFAEEHGYVETLPDKSIDPDHGYPLVCTRSEHGRILPTVPLNYFVQGSACWWMRRAQVRIQELLDEWNRGLDRRDYKMVFDIHDELVFDFPRGRGLKPWLTNLGRVREIQKAMEQGGTDMGFPSPVSIEYHKDNWSQGMVLT